MNTTVNVRLALFVCALLFAGSITRAEQPPQPVEKLTVVDSTGKSVGNVLGFDSSFSNFLLHPIVAVRVNSALAVLGAGPQGFVDIGPANTFGLFFTTVDCTGDGYVSPDEVVEVSLLPLSLARANKVYLQSGSPQSVLLRSFFADTSGLDCVTQEPDDLVTMIPMRLLTELSIFTPPFSIK